MSATTGIEWTDATFNPWRGCTKVSPGCANCYAETLSHRNPKVLGEWGPGKPRVQASESYWRQPLKWNKGAWYFVQCSQCGRREERKWDPTLPPGGLSCCSTPGCLALPESECSQVRRRVFCASLADWLDEEAPIEWLARLLKTIHATPHLDWLLLTKRPQNWLSRINTALWHIEKLPADCDGSGVFPETEVGIWLNEWTRIDGNFAPKDVWIGTTVEDQIRADERIPLLLQIPATVRFLSCEPLLGPLDLVYTCFNGADSFGAMPGIHWVICGGESGPSARAMHPDWALSLRDQCARAKVPFFFKQWGEWKPCFATGDVTVETPGQTIAIKKGEFTAWTKTGKKAAGSLLDGQEHKEFPIGK